MYNLTYNIKLKDIKWKKYRKIIAKKWSPRMNTPFDPVASEKAQELGLEVAILKGTDINNFTNYLNDRVFVGTIIRP